MCPIAVHQLEEAEDSYLFEALCYKDNYFFPLCMYSRLHCDLIAILCGVDMVPPFQGALVFHYRSKNI